MSLIADFRALNRQIRRVLRRRKNRKIVAQLLERQGELPEAHFKAAVYYPDSRGNLYQIRQWFEPMRELAQDYPVVIITRNLVATKLLLEETDIPVHYARTIGEVEAFVSSQRIAAVFYVNHAMRNFQMLRYGEAAHVSISHGESDKPSTSTNQFKAYDHVFVAGQAAEDRIARKLIGYEVSKHVTHTGRPQVNVQYESPGLPRDGRSSVLYAPTWEGDRPSMNFTSILSHGPAVVKALLEDNRYRVIYRPHPRIGTFDAKYRAGHEAVVAMIEEAQQREPEVGHLVDVESRFGWHLAECDVCISDISAVAYDWLATGKPLIMTWPSETEAQPNGGLITMLEPFRREEAPHIVERIAREQAGDLRHKRNEIANYYFGSVEESHMERFLAAARKVIESRLMASALDAPETDEILERTP